jgi:hypothetical protein
MNIFDLHSFDFLKKFIIISGQSNNWVKFDSDLIPLFCEIADIFKLSQNQLAISEVVQLINRN